MHNQMIQEEESLKRLQALLSDMTLPQKVKAAQIAWHQIDAEAVRPVIKLKPFGEIFDYQVQAAIQLLLELPPQTVLETVLEILKECLARIEERPPTP